MSADTTNENLPDTENTSQNKGNTVDAELASVKAQLAELIENQKATMSAIAETRRPAQTEQEPEDDNLYEPNNLLRKAEQVMERKFQAEQAKNAKIAEMGREYPEIHTDTKVMNAVVEELKKLPSSIQQTADGYEMAILKAVTKAGITPRSRRSIVDEDVSLGNSSSSNERKGSQGKKKLSANSLTLASLMGLDVENPEVVKRLEKRAERTKWNKFE